MRLLLTSGAEITGVEGVKDTEAQDDIGAVETLLERIRDRQAEDGWLVLVRTIKRLGLLEEEILYVRPTDVIGVIHEKAPTVAKKAEE